MNQNWNNHNHRSENRKRSQRANENSKWEQANFLTSEWPRLDSSSSAESNGMRGVSFLSQLHYQGKQIKRKAGRFALFFSRVWLISRVGPRVYPRLKIQETYACAATFAMTALKLYRVCVRELACNMHFFFVSLHRMLSWNYLLTVCHVIKKLTE